MSETPINLNRVRKDRARAAKRRQADENSAKFGRTKAQRHQEAIERDNDKNRLDAHKRDDHS